MHHDLWNQRCPSFVGNEHFFMEVIYQKQFTLLIKAQTVLWDQGIMPPGFVFVIFIILNLF